MKKLHSLSASLLLVVILFISGCGKNDDVPDDLLCGSASSWVATDLPNSLIYNDLDIVSGNRTMIFEDITTPEDICTEETTTATFRAYADILPAGMTVKGKAYWGNSGENEITLPHTTSMYESNMVIDLKPQFGTNPGWIGLQIKVIFPTQGSFSADSLYVQNNISNMTIVYTYHKN
ncbi:MAG: hypothetical protein POELPBGB_01747 [Bacteroidia bacterium]|nr:hypothetical protein [Bacteroidia bacterium]